MAMFREPQLILFSENVTRITHFYEKLGFTETFRVPADGEPIHIDLTLDGYKICFSSVDFTRDDHGLEPVTGVQHTAVILWTDDTPAAYEHVLSLGAPAGKGRTSGWAGCSSHGPRTPTATPSRSSSRWPADISRC